MTVGRFFFGLGLATLCAFVLAGCGAKGGTGGKPVASGGTILLDGAPLEGVVITFVPTGAGQAATGVSGSGGTFRLTTRNTGDGAVPGTYKVTVKKSDSMGEGSSSPKDPGDLMKMMEKMAKSKSSSKPGGGIHPNYGTVEKTPLTWEIPSSGDRNIKLELNKSGT